MCRGTQKKVHRDPLFNAYTWKHGGIITMRPRDDTPKNVDISFSLWKRVLKKYPTVLRAELPNSPRIFIEHHKDTHSFSLMQYFADVSKTMLLEYLL